MPRSSCHVARPTVISSDLFGATIIAKSLIALLASAAVAAMIRSDDAVRAAWRAWRRAVEVAVFTAAAVVAASTWAVAAAVASTWAVAVAAASTVGVRRWRRLPQWAAAVAAFPQSGGARRWRRLPQFRARARRRGFHGFAVAASAGALRVIVSPATFMRGQGFAGHAICGTLVRRPYLRSSRQRRTMGDRRRFSGHAQRTRHSYAARRRQSPRSSHARSVRAQSVRRAEFPRLVQFQSHRL